MLVQKDATDQTNSANDTYYNKGNQTVLGHCLILWDERGVMKEPIAKDG